MCTSVSDQVEPVDVLIVGAGLSGIGAACHLERRCPDRSWAILEARDRLGGTWDLFRYPGVRSDSDMHTLGYSFAPWEDARAIADGPSILRYIQDTADRFAVRERIRLGRRVQSAEWSSADAAWTVEVRRTDTGETERLRCRFLLVCAGYYRYDQGYAPELPGADRFPGPIVHPQHWPEDLDYAGRRIVVIGSGATAVTLVPALAQTAAHVTMLQRSPSYILSMPSRDDLALRLRRRLPPAAAYGIVRWRNVAVMTLLYQLSRRRPRLIRRLLRQGLVRQLPDGYDVDTHFNPPYEPWDQRMCFVPDGDLLGALRTGSASIVTDRIETLTERGIRLAGGHELEADVIVTATGLRLQALGGLALTVDGRAVRVRDALVYKGAMLSGVPNLAFVMGYTNASWTLRADLTGDYVCRVLNHMTRHGYARCVPTPDGGPMGRAPLIDLSAGYVRRAAGDLPSQGTRRPWRIRQNYALDRLDLKLGRLDDGVLRFDGAATAAPAISEPATVVV